MKRRKKFRTGLIIFCIAFAVWYVKYAGHHAVLQQDAVPQDFWGVTFSKKYATELGLDWKEAYLAILDDLQVKNVRLPVYWDDIENKVDSFDFTDYDWMLAEGAKRNVKFIINLGRRLPRWPECHQPSWTQNFSPEEMRNEQIAMVSAAVDHFRAQPAITSWQLENEFFFRWFGRCPEPDPELLTREIAYVRASDPRPVVLTDSGELNSWRKAADLSDVLGITMYRVVWSKYFGYVRYPWPAALYKIKASAVKKSPQNVIIAELQAEPWPSHNQGVTEISPLEAERSFNVKQLETNSEMARRTGFTKAYFWGAEWWYWLKVHGDDEIWLKAKEILSYGENR